jgi:SET domain-containing protein
MRLLTRFLKKRKSRLPDSGYGLFTTCFIPRNTLLTEYYGIVITEGQTTRDNVNILSIGDILIDGSLCKARFINDANGISKKHGCVNNCKFKLVNQKIFIVTLRDIDRGEELYLAYGPEYWKQVCANILGE